MFDFEADDMTEMEYKVNQNDFNSFIYTESKIKLLIKNVDDKIIISKDLSEIKKKIIDGSLGKVIGEITNMSSKYILFFRKSVHFFHLPFL